MVMIAITITVTTTIENGSRSPNKKWVSASPRVLIHQGRDFYLSGLPTTMSNEFSGPPMFRPLLYDVE